MPSNGVCATACRCGANSERVCDQVDCPTPDCDNPVSVHGQCCPVCGCKSDDGVIEPFGKWILSLSMTTVKKPFANGVNQDQTVQNVQSDFESTLSAT